MKILQNEPLKKYSTFQMGGLARKIYFPETLNDLKKLYYSNVNMTYILGSGSNILINDEKIFDEIVSVRSLKKELEYRGDGVFYVTASVSLQELTKEINDKGYGGIEYLYSVPGLTGGAIYMNAGRGKVYRKVISDFLISVEYFQNGKIFTIPTEECQFGHRTSIFQNMNNTIILGALFRFPKMDKEKSKLLISERLELVKKTQDLSMANMGSIFSVCDSKIMDIVREQKLGDEDVRFSEKTANWILHSGNGRFEQVENLIYKVKKVHELLDKTCQIEIKIWD